MFGRFLLAALLMLCGIQAAQAQTLPKLTGRVVDAANLLSPEQEAQLTQLSADIEKTSSRQFVVATIPDLQDYPIEDYGNKLIRGWGIGQKGANNGIILIVAPTERKVRIEVGYGLEPIMTDALSSMIINDTILPKFKSGDMAGGIVAGANAIGEQMKLPLEAAEARALQQTSRPAARSRSSGGFPFVLVFWIIVIAFVVLSRFRRGTSGRRYRSGIAPVVLWGPGLGGGSGGGWSSGWGGGGGGSDWGGGGGGGFSGGGGSGGGGGASGSW
ncbi:MAG: Beta-propeller domain of methanol dehydrogenase type [Sphingomonas bacterium]|uniref:TPM domain-containing protein n=1 Tax=Sphingomonas bacterium TaxID=1895847 RepID=UPI00261D490C|nr:TPM domain-containing protein [Sphingomonas bacterium]MDB5705831.1 Beta-propeller domain of methanol dehydrogenase type [Sphingomonas bacterium]